jgi:hypothetical protein
MKTMMDGRMIGIVMNKIQEIYYEELDNDICSIEEAGQYYYYSNYLDDENYPEYEKYEMNQIKLRNIIIGNAKKRGDIENVKVDSSILALSTLKNKVVLFVDVM